jgi:hypothetical protein
MLLEHGKHSKAVPFWLKMMRGIRTHTPEATKVISNGIISDK